jgi:type IV pilus assembly protein PilQ
MKKTLRYFITCAVGALAMSTMVSAKDGAAPASAVPSTTVVSAPATVTVVTTNVAASVVATNAPVVVATQPVPDEPIEIGYIEADIQNVLRTLATKADINLILGDEVTGKVTVNLKGVSYEGAMQLIAESKGYAFVKDGNIVKVKSKESLDTEAVELRVYTLNYAKADDIKKTLDAVLTKQGKIQIDTRSNTLVLSDTPSNLSKIIPLIQALDTQTPQVLIEAKFVETTKNPQKDLGVDWTTTLLGHQVVIGGAGTITPGTPPTVPVNGQNQPSGGL